MGDLIFGTDTSKYQPLGSYEPGAFEIINGEEPDGAGGDFTATLQRNVREGRPQGVYIWVYPAGANVLSVVQRTRGILGGDPELGYWLDYEAAGIHQGLIDIGLDTADRLGARMGIYTYLYLLPSVDTRGRDLWLAYYPGANDGNYQPQYSDTARQHGAKIHQFSSGGGLDRNVVLDEAWYGVLVGGVPVPGSPAPLPVEDEMPEPIYRFTGGGAIDLLFPDGTYLSNHGGDGEPDATFVDIAVSVEQIGELRAQHQPLTQVRERVHAAVLASGGVNKVKHADAAAAAV